MNNFKKVFSWALEIWQLLLAAVLGAVAYSKFEENQRLKAEKIAREAAEKTNAAKEKAKKEEQEKIKAAEQRAEEEKEQRDKKILEERKKEDEEINEKVQDLIEKDQKDPESLAKEFANAFGGTYVKKEE